MSKETSEAIETAVCPKCDSDTEQIYKGLTISEHVTFATEGKKSEKKIIVEVTLNCAHCGEMHHHRISELLRS